MNQKFNTKLTPNDRPDIISRVFKMKLKYFLDDIIKNQIFGIVTGHIHVIKFQKRGLPHAHKIKKK